MGRGRRRRGKGEGEPREEARPAPPVAVPETTTAAGGSAARPPAPAVATAAAAGEGHLLVGKDGGFLGGRAPHAVVEGDGEGLLRSRSDEGADDGKASSFLIRAVLSWTLEDVQNENLFEIPKMPAMYTSLQQYLDTHSNLLVEEVRASIHSSMLETRTTQYYNVLSVTWSGPSSEYYVDIDLHGLDDCHHVVHDGDVFVLSSQLPRNMDNLVGCLAVAVGVGQDIFFQKGFRVLTSKHYKEADSKAIKYVSFLTNIMDDTVVSKAIEKTMFDNFSTIKSLLQPIEKIKDECIYCNDTLVAWTDHSNKYDEEQLDAVIGITSKLRCTHHDSINLVWGPPGSGKTRVAIGIVKFMMDIGFRTLVCLPREDDIADLLKNLKNHFPSFNFSGTVVLNKVNYLGNTENHNMFHDMRLENRAQALYCCIFLWRSFVKEIGFVLGLKPYCKEKCVHDGSNMCDKTKLLVFSWSSFKTKVSALAMEVKKCSHLLIDRFSDISLSDDDIQNLNKLTRGISHLENQMQNCDITHSNVERIFGLGSGLGFDLEGIGFYITELNETRMSCLGLIEIVVNSIELPQLNDRKEFEEFCIKHSRTIICTPACSSQLHDLKLDSIDILLVDDAGQIRESDMLMPLSFSPRHIVMLGDHLHIQPMVKSEVCQDAGFGSSLFQRLSHIYSQKKILCKQYMINPSISQFMNEHFYEGRLEDGWIVKSDGYNNLLNKFPSYTYGFFDISAVDELREKGNFFVESAAVMGLLQSLCKGLTNDTGKINVGMVCLSYSKMDEMQNFLGIKYENHERINVEVSSLDNLSQKWYDVVILSSVFDDKSELPEGNKINVALTKSRHCLWIIGEAVKLGASGDTWQKLIANAKERRCCAKLNSKVLAKVMRQSEAYHQDRDRSTAANSALPKNIMQKPGEEFTWAGRPNNSKYILAPLRDQKAAPDTCTFQASLGAVESLKKFQFSCFDPPQDFTWTLSLSNLKSQYEHTVAGEFASEETKERGKRRLETALDILKDHGVIGHHKVEFEDRLFKISSYEKVDVDDSQKVRSLLEAGNIMVGYFRVSRNYFYLKPGEIYMYDKTRPYIHAKSNPPVSHAVMVIGDGRKPTASAANETSQLPTYNEHVMIQNSEGKRFGIDGLGRVDKPTLRRLYKITLPD